MRGFRPTPVSAGLLAIGALAMLGFAWALAHVPTIEERRAAELQRIRAEQVARVRARDVQLRAIAAEIVGSDADRSWAGDFYGAMRGNKWESLHLRVGTGSYALLFHTDVLLVDPSAPEEQECPHETLVESGQVEIEGDRVRLRASGARCLWTPHEFRALRRALERQLTEVPVAGAEPEAHAARTILTSRLEDEPVSIP